jgi:cell division protease FtsH
MSDLLGPVTYERPRQPMFLPENYAPGKTYSETRATQIDEEISSVMEKAQERARNILTERRKVLDDLARLLTEKEMVQGEELRKMLSEYAAEIAAAAPVQPS